jgi:hypothetical protein
VAGLCSSGPHPRLGVSDQMMPLKEMQPDWKPARYESRITLGQVDNEELKEKYEGLYCRVYGGKPDNGSIAHFFVRAATYYFDKNMPVNWAQLAMEIWAGRYKDPLNNLCNLVPPCLTKQMQGFVDEVGAYIQKMYELTENSSCATTSEQSNMTGQEEVALELDIARGKLKCAEEEVVAAEKMVSLDSLQLSFRTVLCCLE